MILADDVKSKSNLSFASGNSPHYLSKNGSTRLHLQPKLEHSNLNSTQLISNNRNHPINQHRLTQLDRNSGVYNLKDVSRPKIFDNFRKQSVID